MCTHTETMRKQDLVFNMCLGLRKALLVFPPNLWFDRCCCPYSVLNSFQTLIQKHCLRLQPCVFSCSEWRYLVRHQPERTHWQQIRCSEPAVHWRNQSNGSRACSISKYVFQLGGRAWLKCPHSSGTLSQHNHYVSLKTALYSSRFSLNETMSQSPAVGHCFSLPKGMPTLYWPQLCLRKVRSVHSRKACPFLLTLWVHDGQHILCTKKSRHGGRWDLRTFSGRALVNKICFGDCEIEEISQIGLRKPSAILRQLPVITFS